MIQRRRNRSKLLLAISGALAFGVAACGNETATLNEIEAERTEEISADARAIFDAINQGDFVDDAIGGYAAGFRGSPRGQSLEAQYPGLVAEFLRRSEPIVRDYYEKAEPAMTARLTRTFDDEMTPKQRAEFLEFIRSDTGQLFFGKLDVESQIEQSGGSRPEDIQRAGERAGIRAVSEMTPEQQAEVAAFEQRLQEPLLAVGQAQTEALYDVMADFQNSPEAKRVNDLLEQMVEDRAGG